MHSHTNPMNSDNEDLHDDSSSITQDGAVLIDHTFFLHFMNL